MVKKWLSRTFASSNVLYYQPILTRHCRRRVYTLTLLTVVCNRIKILNSLRYIHSPPFEILQTYLRPDHRHARTIKSLWIYPLWKHHHCSDAIGLDISFKVRHSVRGDTWKPLIRCRDNYIFLVPKDQVLRMWTTCLIVSCFGTKSIFSFSLSPSASSLPCHMRLYKRNPSGLYPCLLSFGCIKASILLKSFTTVRLVKQMYCMKILIHLANTLWTCSYLQLSAVD